jgi:hypothetical protein
VGTRDCDRFSFSLLSTSPGKRNDQKRGKNEKEIMERETAEIFLLKSNRREVRQVFFSNDARR